VPDSDGNLWPQRSLTAIDELSIHHTVSPNREWSTFEEIDHVDNIYAQHRAGGRFAPNYSAPGIGYWFLCFPSGRVYQVGALADQRAAVAGQNNHIIAVALVGDFTEQQPTGAALEAARRLRAALEEELGRTLVVRPHRYYGGTACPGATWQAWISLLN
jgi:hypothetical protein